MPKFIRTILPHAILTMLVIGVATAYAWTAPTQSPPNGNVAAPINVGAVDQVKAAGLGVTNLIANQICFGADCRSAWPSSSGDNLGNHTATQALNMNSNPINGATIITSTTKVTSPQFCIGTSCISAWSQAGSAPSTIVYSCPSVANGCASTCTGNLSQNSTCSYTNLSTGGTTGGNTCNGSVTRACSQIGHLVP